MNRRGWLRILEAAIAVMLVSGVLLTVYSKQEDRRSLPSDYFSGLLRQILADISVDSDLRFNVLNVNPTNPNDGNLSMIRAFVGGKIPNTFNYSIRICDFNGSPCKMFDNDYIASVGSDVFVEETVIASELRDGEGLFSPKKLRIFIWEQG